MRICKNISFKFPSHFGVPFLCFNMERLRDSALYDGNLSQLIAVSSVLSTLDEATQMGGLGHSAVFVASSVGSRIAVLIDAVPRCGV